jgi:hypothetical protein
MFTKAFKDYDVGAQTFEVEVNEPPRLTQQDCG